MRSGEAYDPGTYGHVDTERLKNSSACRPIPRPNLRGPRWRHPRSRGFAARISPDGRRPGAGTSFPGTQDDLPDERHAEGPDGGDRSVDEYPRAGQHDLHLAAPVSRPALELHLTGAADELVAARSDAVEVLEAIESDLGSPALMVAAALTTDLTLAVTIIQQDRRETLGAAVNARPAGA